MKTIAVIGASKNREKFGNKCIRAYMAAEYTVYPVNPHENEIEGLKCYKSVLDIKDKVDIISLYVLPSVTKEIINEIIKKKPDAVYFNPGTDDLETEKKLEEKGISVKKQCSIVALGVSPSQFN
jgi:predicted CoA-binding protein